MVIDKKLFILCIVIIFLLSAAIGVSYTQQRRSSATVGEFVEKVRAAKDDGEVVRLTDEFADQYESLISLSQSEAGFRRDRNRGASKLPTKQPPIVYNSPSPKPSEPQILTYSCDDSQPVCITRLSPGIASFANINKQIIALTGRGFSERSIIEICPSDSKTCNTIINPKNIQSVSATNIEFVISDYLEYACRADEACLAGFARGVPVNLGNYSIRVSNTSGQSNSVIIEISK